MFGFGKNKECPERRGFREEFEKTVAQLRTAPDASQIAVGHAINTANSMFAKTFGSASGFIGRPSQAQTDYITKLTDMENRLSESDGASSLGFGLFKMWVGTLRTGDADLQVKFSKELAFFSKKGDLGE